MIALGRAFHNDNSIDDEYARKEGVRQFNVSFQNLKRIIEKKVLKNQIIVAVSNSNKDGNSGIQHSSMQATRMEIYRMSDTNAKVATYGSIKPCVTGSDAHILDKVK